MAAQALDCTVPSHCNIIREKFWRFITNINAAGVSSGHRSPTALPIANLEGWIRRPLQPVISRVESWLRALHLREIGAQPKLGSGSLGVLLPVGGMAWEQIHAVLENRSIQRGHQTNRPNTARITDNLIDESSSPCTEP